MNRILEKCNGDKTNVKRFILVKGNLRVANINVTVLKDRRLFRKILEFKGIQKEKKDCANQIEDLLGFTRFNS